MKKINIMDVVDDACVLLEYLDMQDFLVLYGVNHCWNTWICEHLDLFSIKYGLPFTRSAKELYIFTKYSANELRLHGKSMRDDRVCKIAKSRHARNSHSIILNERKKITRESIDWLFQKIGYNEYSFFVLHEIKTIYEFKKIIEILGDELNENHLLFCIYGCLENNNYEIPIYILQNFTIKFRYIPEAFINYCEKKKLNFDFTLKFEYIDLVMHQTDCSNILACISLFQCNGDVVNAIILLNCGY